MASEADILIMGATAMHVLVLIMPLLDKAIGSDMASNKTIAKGLIGSYMGADRKDVIKLLESAAQAGRADQVNATMAKIQDVRGLYSQTKPETKVDRFKKRWVLEAIDSLLAAL